MIKEDRERGAGRGEKGRRGERGARVRTRSHAGGSPAPGCDWGVGTASALG